MARFPAGWYSASPNSRLLRWWDGTHWTERTTTADAATAMNGPVPPGADSAGSQSASSWWLFGNGRPFWWQPWFQALVVIVVIAIIFFVKLAVS